IAEPSNLFARERFSFRRHAFVCIAGSDAPQQRTLCHVIRQYDWTVLAAASDGLARVESQRALLLERAVTGVAARSEQRLYFPEVVHGFGSPGAQASAKNDG